jgi:hypothetical protein
VSINGINRWDLLGLEIEDSLYEPGLKTWIPQVQKGQALIAYQHCS